MVTVTTEMRKGSAPRLTRRQREILSLVLAGKTNRQIAEILGLHVQTVKNQLRDGYEKLGFKPATGPRAEATRFALGEFLSDNGGMTIRRPKERIRFAGASVLEEQTDTQAINHKTHDQPYGRRQKHEAVATLTPPP